MLSLKTVLLALALTAWAAPIKREVPQEHSHEPILRSVTASVNKNNPDNLGDSVFGLLGDAAAAKGLGKTQDPKCLQQALADRAFTNAKAAGDINGQVDALIYRALERNSGSVGGLSPKCESATAVNPEVAAIQQHQDPASTDAATVNKAIALELAKQIASIGGDPLRAIESGTFPPGELGDATAKGNTCDDANDAKGCINTLGLLVPDVSEDEIKAAVAGIAAGGNGDAGNGNDNQQNNGDNGGAAGNGGAATETCSPVTVTVTAGAATATAAPPAPPAPPANPPAPPANPPANGGGAAGENFQKFEGDLGDEKAPTVTKGGRGFVVEGSDDFLNVGAALGRSCDIQKNKCANKANSGAGDFSVQDCDAQNQECRALI